jgi:GTP cyclohydrolase I
MNKMYEDLPEVAKESIKREVIFDLLGDVIGEDATREGLRDTPARVVKAWKHWCGGYALNPKDILKVFTDGADGCDQMVVRKNIPIYSHCEHHLAPIIGRCTIAYIPNGSIVGLSKMDRLADMFARRLQVQERLTNQIADAMQEHLKPLGVGVWISARHMCVESRGVQNADSETVTTALRGALRDEPETRAEFLAACRS